MANPHQEINALIALDPAKAAEIILDALRDAGMHKGNAAKAMECSHGTLLRWIARLNLDAKIAKMLKDAERKGWRHNGRTGRPERKLKIRGRVATIAEWAAESGIKPATIVARLERGVSAKNAVFKPLGSRQ